VAGIYDSGGIGRRAAGRKDKDCRQDASVPKIQIPIRKCNTGILPVYQNTISYTFEIKANISSKYFLTRIVI
jgi:hypothetical protein